MELYLPTVTVPLTIIVTEDRWEAYGDPTYSWHKYLYDYLVENGGINESVSPGEYTFNIVRKQYGVYAELLAA